MTLANTYKKIKSSVVAIVKREITIDAQFPEILGTGFFVHEDGVILTNHHVLEQIEELKVHPPDRISDLIVIFYFERDEGGMRIVAIGPDNAGKIDMKRLEKMDHYGPNKFDVAMITLPGLKDCPTMKISDTKLNEGDEIAIAGFPMGTDALRAPGWLHQLGPTLQKGIVSSILPCPCETPHGLLLNLMIHGGSSRSPVFLPDTGEVVGIVYSRLNDYERETDSESGAIRTYAQPTSLSLAVPGWYLKDVVKTIDEHMKKQSKVNKLSFNDYLKTLPKHNQKPKGAFGPVQEAK